VHYLIDHDGNAVEVGRAQTDDDGRIRDLGPLTRGDHRLVFVTASRSEFYPHVTVDFVVLDDQRHHHVPLLLSPFGYSTYRGS
jgi:5-hydroxyisourate hydrolase